MSVRLWMREEFGDFNFEQVFDTRSEAVTEMYKIKDRGGYFTKDATVFVPWHQVELVQIDAEEN